MLTDQPEPHRHPDIFAAGSTPGRAIGFPAEPPSTLVNTPVPGGASSTPGGPAAAAPTFAPGRARSAGRRIARAPLVIAVIVVLLAAGAATWWWLLRDNPVDLTVNNLPIRNAEQILDTAQPVFTALAAADQATVPAGAGCWFAPAANDDTVRAPRVACGPVALGIAGNGQRWVVGTVSYSPSREDTVGEFTEFSEVVDLDVGTLNRPDGAAAPEGKELTASSGGARTVDGRRLVNVESTVSAADAAFNSLVSAEASVSTDSRCYLGVNVNGNRSIADGSILCGPVLLRKSDRTKQWAKWTFNTQQGDLLVDATITAPTMSSLTSTEALAAGVTLYRPDGATPPGIAGLSMPDAPPQRAGYLTSLDEVLGAPKVSLTAPKDARLFTPALSLTLTGLAAVPRIGAGQEAIVAADGEKLVVATYTTQQPKSAPSTGTTAFLLIDDRRIALASLRFADAGTLIFSVPAATRAVELQFLTEGRTEGISLLTGQRGAGSPKAPYRQQPIAGQTVGFTVRVKVPKGDPVLATGAVTESQLAEWTETTGYAPAGSAVLSLIVSQWQLTEPCCDVADLTTTTRWHLVLPDGTKVAAQPVPDARASTPAPVFLVPDTVTSVQLVLDFDVRFTSDKKPGAAAGTSGPLKLTIPG